MYYVYDEILGRLVDGIEILAAFSDPDLLKTNFKWQHKYISIKNVQRLTHI